MAVLGAKLVNELDAEEKVMCGCPVTPELIQSLSVFKGNHDQPQTRFNYTFVTDVGTFVTNNMVHFNITNEFLILRLSETDGASHEDLYIRLCLVKSVTETYDSQ
jgi:hypothetical protein